MGKMIWIVLGLVLLALAGYAAYWYLQHSLPTFVPEPKTAPFVPAPQP